MGGAAAARKQRPTQAASRGPLSTAPVVYGACASPVAALSCVSLRARRNWVHAWSNAAQALPLNGVHTSGEAGLGAAR